MIFYSTAHMETLHCLHMFFKSPAQELVAFFIAVHNVAMLCVLYTLTGVSYSVLMYVIIAELLSCKLMLHIYEMF